MPLKWKHYDEYFNHPRDQQQIDDNRKLDIEKIAAEILHLDAQTMKSNWGSCSPPGVFAQTVVRVESSTPHRFSGICQNKAIGLKIFKNGKGRKLVLDHKHSRHKLPGLPNELVQGVYDADEHNDTFYLVQEWIDGESLETYLNRKTHLPPDVAQQLLNDLFEGIIIPLWSAGTIWWDIRAGNFCVAERDGKQRLVLIDTDSLLAYAKEIIETPHVFTKRNHGKVTALKRIKTIVTDLVLSAIPEENPRSNRSIEKQIRAIADASLIAFDEPQERVNGQRSFETLIKRLEIEAWRILNESTAARS
jgi:serine/threonine protein kinase